VGVKDVAAHLEYSEAEKAAAAEHCGAHVGSKAKRKGPFKQQVYLPLRVNYTVQVPRIFLGAGCFPTSSEGR